MWLPEDRQCALAWAAEQACRCPGCGHPVDETYDSTLTNKWAAERAICKACDAQERAAERHQESQGVNAPKVHQRAVHWHVHRVD